MIPQTPAATRRSRDSGDSERSEPRRPHGERLPRPSRVRLGGEIRSLLRRGSRRRDPLLEVFSAPAAEEGRPRFGVIVPLHRHTVVERNRLRRRLKEIGRRDVLPRLRGKGCDTDVLVRSFPAAYEATFPALREALIRSTERLCSDASS